MTLTSLYATNVMHYGHVVQAYLNDGFEVTLMAPWRPTPALVECAARHRAPRRLISRLDGLARARIASVRYQGLGMAQFLPQLAVRVPIPLSRATRVRAVTHALAKRVSRAAARTSPDVLQFVEGLGYLSVLEGTHRRAVMERRNLHHSVFEAEIEPLLGFPASVTPDPIRDELEIEYSAADRIIVYSAVARRSFLERGYSPDKVFAVPLAIPPLPVVRRADVDSKMIAYIGRLDVYKGVDVAVAAVKELGAGYRLQVAGPGTPEAIRWLRSFEHVDYVGVVDRPGVSRILERAAAVVSPSVESFGLAVAEAAVNGVPVVIRETTGIGDYLPASLRNVVVGREVTDWADALTRVLQDRTREVANDVTALTEALTWQRSEREQRSVIRTLTAGMHSEQSRNTS